MASAPMDENPMYRYELMESIWLGHFRRKHRSKLPTAEEFFRNFVRHHKAFLFSIVKIFDGTSHVMVDKNQYQKITQELEKKTGTSLPEIRLTDMSSPENVIESTRGFTSQEQFRDFVRDLQTENENVHKRARQNAADKTSKLRQMLSDKKDTKFLSFDLEVYDKDRKTMLEIGYAKFTLKEGDTPEYFHAIVTDNLHLHNSNVSDNRENFKFGKSTHMTLKEAAEQLQKAVSEADTLVTHAGGNDNKYLAENGITIEEKPVFDTQVLALDVLPRGPKTWGLRKMLGDLYISYDERLFHNAGNDAHYTMLAFKALVKRAMPGTKF